MEPKEHSLFTSTFSAMTFLVVLAFTLLCLWTRDTANLERLATLLLGAYGVKKGQELSNGPK